MEVHPPEHGIHSWRDFFVHIGTIVIGLLIAIGLEQSVEALHHRHLRIELEQNMREEAETNSKLLVLLEKNAQRISDYNIAFLHELQNATPERGVFHITVPARDSTGTARVVSGTPHTVWQVAVANGTAGYVSPDRAALYTRGEQTLQTFDDELHNKIAPEDRVWLKYGLLPKHGQKLSLSAGERDELLDAYAKTVQEEEEVGYDVFLARTVQQFIAEGATSLRGYDEFYLKQRQVQPKP